MERLIGANALIEEINRQIRNVCTDGSWASEATTFVADRMIKLVNNQPTAYDVEKVVAELEDKTAMDIFDKDWYVRRNDAIKIVRKGGVE